MIRECVVISNIQATRSREQPKIVASSLARSCLIDVDCINDYSKRDNCHKPDSYSLALSHAHSLTHPGPTSSKAPLQPTQTTSQCPQQKIQRWDMKKSHTRPRSSVALSDADILTSTSSSDENLTENKYTISSHLNCSRSLVEPPDRSLRLRRRGVSTVQRKSKEKTTETHKCGRREI